MPLLMGSPIIPESPLMMGSKPRSPHWETFRKEYLKKFPQCAITGATEGVELHHKVPYHIDESLELVESNIIGLIRPIHFYIAHGGNWHDYVKDINYIASVLSVFIKQRTKT